MIIVLLQQTQQVSMEASKDLRCMEELPVVFLSLMFTFSKTIYFSIMRLAFPVLRGMVLGGIALTGTFKFKTL